MVIQLNQIYFRICEVISPNVENRTLLPVSDVRGRFYNDFLALLWLYFANVLCKADVSADVVAVFNMEFVQLPWQQLLPNIYVMETMARVSVQFR